MYEYIYSISNDTLNSKADNAKLFQEVADSPITVALNNVSTSGDNLTFNFKSTLATSWQTQLDTIVANHNGEPLVDSERISVLELSTIKTDDEGNPILAGAKPVGDYNTMVSHNYCDNTTWSATSDSSWVLEPSAGEIISIDKSEVQFSHNLQFESNSIQLNYYIWHPVEGSIIGQTLTFSSLYSLFEIGNAHWHCPAIGTEIPHGLTTIEFAQKTVLELYGDQPTDGTVKLHKVEVKILADHELTGDYVSASFVTSSRTA